MFLEHAGVFPTSGPLACCLFLDTLHGDTYKAGLKPTDTLLRVRGGFQQEPQFRCGFTAQSLPCHRVERTKDTFTVYLHVGTKERMRARMVFSAQLRTGTRVTRRAAPAVSTDYTRPLDTQASEWSERSFLLAKHNPVAPGRTCFTKHSTFILCNSIILF